MALFDDEPDPADIEADYINRVIPNEASDLWERSIAESPVWESYSPEDHMFLADMFADALFSGSIYQAEDFTEYLEVEWDDNDIADFFEAYESLTG